MGRRTPDAWPALALLLAAAGAAAAPAALAPVGAVGAAPRVMLWAWERPEDLRFVDPRTTGIAFLAGTVRLAGERVAGAPRRQPLRTRRDARVLAVVRVEVDHRTPPVLDAAQAVAAAGAVARLAGPGPVQVDFDAAVSERPFQRRLLAALRARLPPGAFLSVTALVSSCLDGSAARLGADEVVPMALRLGPEGPALRRRLARRPLPAPCDRALGVATDEPAVPRPPGVRLYLFSPRPWDRAALDAALEAPAR